MGKASRRRRDQNAPAGDPPARMASTATPAPAPAAPAPAKPQMDTRPAQMERAAHYLTNHPDSTAKEIDAAIDTGCIMALHTIWLSIPYGSPYHMALHTIWLSTRQVRTYRLLYRPRTQPDLFPTA